MYPSCLVISEILDFPSASAIKDRQVLSPSTAVILSNALGINADFSAPATTSPLPFARAVSRFLGKPKGSAGLGVSVSSPTVGFRLLSSAAEGLRLAAGGDLASRTRPHSASSTRIQVCADSGLRVSSPIRGR